MFEDRFLDPEQPSPRIHQAQFRILGQDFRGLVRPVLEQLQKKVASQPFDTNTLHALLCEDSQGDLQPIGLAAAIAFWAFFSIFPLLLGLFSAAGYFLESEDAQARLMDLVTQSLPGSANFVRGNLEGVVRVRGTLGVVGILGLLWSASAGFEAITRAINQTLEAKRTQSGLLSKLRYFLMTVAVSVFLLLSVGVTAALEVLANRDLNVIRRLGIEPGTIESATGWFTGFAFAFVMFALVYKVAPYVETRWRQVVPGALLGAAVFELGKRAFLLYLSRMADFEAVYGSLSSIIVLLLWLYFEALVLLLGAEYNIVRWQERHGTESQPQAGAT